MFVNEFVSATPASIGKEDPNWRDGEVYFLSLAPHARLCLRMVVCARKDGVVVERNLMIVMEIERLIQDRLWQML